MSYSLSEAAKATGCNKTTILRAIKTGKISATRDEHGNWCIEPAEVHRVYVPVAQAPATHHDALADILVAELRAMLADVRNDRDRWHAAHTATQAALEEALAVQRQLAAPPATPIAMPPQQDASPIELSAPPVATVEPQPLPKRRWWRRRAAG